MFSSTEGMRQPLRMLVIQPDPLDDLNRFAGWLESEGVSFDIRRPFEGDSVDEVVDADALIVLGGSMGVMDAEQFPWLTDLKLLMRRAVSDEVPVLGICLGAQVLAEALGGEVRRGDRGLEAGVAEVIWQPSSVDDPLVGGLPQPSLVGHMHGDEISRIPADAELLGTGTTYRNQAFRVGTAWGVQFHPELSPELFSQWKAEIQPYSDDFEHWANSVEMADRHLSAGGEMLARRFAAIARSVGERSKSGTDGGEPGRMHI
jgi:GMP synthase (glutamine-hydrolysing)